VAEQAINTIYLLGEHPDIICTEIIRAKAAQVFNLSPSNETTKDASDADATMSMNTTESMDTTQEACVTSPYELSQLLFVAGHVAIKQIVHLEMIEAELKRRKAEETGKFYGCH
jgi:condensin complex subunit 1